MGVLLAKPGSKCQISAFIHGHASKIQIRVSRGFVMIVMKYYMPFLALALLFGQALAQSDDSLNPSYTFVDPAIRDMLNSINAPRPLPSAEYLSSTNAAGEWRLDLSDGGISTINLYLSQYGNAVFGSGNLTAAGGPQHVTASGSLTGTVLSLDVVTVGGAYMYRLSADLGTQPTRGTYSLFSSGAVPQTGTVRISRAIGQA